MWIGLWYVDDEIWVCFFYELNIVFSSRYRCCVSFLKLACTFLRCFGSCENEDGFHYPIQDSGLIKMMFLDSCEEGRDKFTCWA